MIELSQSANDRDAVNLSPAGDVYNTAVYLKRLAGSKADISFCSAVGNDPYSDRIVEFLEHEEIATGDIRRDETRNCGLYAIATDESGERSFYYWRDRSAARTLFETDRETAVLEMFDAVFLSGITLAILGDDARRRLMEKLESLQKRSGLQVIFDSNYRQRLWLDTDAARYWTGQAWAMADIALPSLDDEMDLFGEQSESEVMQRFRSYGVRTGALKRGGKGAISLGEEPVSVEPPTVMDVVDTTAAGDSFNAGFLAGILFGRDAAGSIALAQQTAAQVIRFKGAIVPRPDWDRLISEKSFEI